MRTHFVLLLTLVACQAGAGDEDGSTTASASAGEAGSASSTGAAATTEDAPEPTTGSPATTAATSTGVADTGTSVTASAAGSEGTDGGADTGTTGELVPQPAIVHYVGRHDDSDPARVRMSWSGVGLAFRFEGTDASVRLDDSAKYWTLVVDNQVQPNLVTSPGDQTYPVAVGLPFGEHMVELYRRTEGSFGPTSVLGVEVVGEPLPPPYYERRMEVIGDSISCGYGNEGVSPCSFSAETESHFWTYGAVAARTVGAEISTVAWSGKGVVNNYGNDTFEPLPQIYDRTIATEAAAWDFSWQPDVVVINLGTNDFSTDGDPSEAVFVAAYVQLLAHIRDVYPDAFILPVAPVLFGNEATMVAGYLQDAVDQRHMAGDLDVAFADINVQWNGSGCDGHPNLEAHEGMAARLVEELQDHLGW